MTVVVLPSRHDGRAPCEDGFVPRDVTDDMLDELALRGPWDGVLVILDGQSARDGHDSAARRMGKRVRHILGPDVPVGTVDNVHTDIADQLSEGLVVLSALRRIALGPAAG
ncbi:M81 family metallopeptidase [Haloechinothrix salitolerans]|uniref:M81 family metallopeptidase n=1 Tax=Haloechinothrix salitolerans TaxID=926830 RepID=A0ABW2BWN6_9PSEU